MKRLLRGAVRFDITLAVGRADISLETPVTVQGFKPEIDRERWIIQEVAYNIDGGGYVCALKLEALIAELD